jgi:spoIIIJ-associated protein
MLKWIESTGKTENDAIAAALKQLGLDRDSVSVEVIARAKTGFLGIGSQPARIKVTYEVPDPVVEEPKEEEQAPVVNAAPAAPAAQEAEKAPAQQSAPAPQEDPAQEKEAGEAAEESAENSEPKRQRRRKKKTQEVPAQPKAEQETPAAPAAPAEPAPDRTEEINAFLTGLMEKLDVEARPVIALKEDNIYAVELVGENLGGLIGRRGETLDAIQQLTNYAVNNGQTQRVRIHIDAENYRAKREESLQRLARKTAGKAMKYRRNMMLEPMNAYERHVIHAALQDYDPSISTYSTGTEPNRRIVVAYGR